MTRAALALVMTVVAFGCGERQAIPSASNPTSAGSGMPSSPPSSDFDAGATPRSTLQKLAEKPDDGRVVVDAIIVRVESPDKLIVTNDFADSAAWTLRTSGLTSIDKLFVVGARYTLLVLVQNGVPKVIGGGAR
jgi:hypothetical protein